MRRVDLARRLVLTPSGVTRLLEGLERAGLVERAVCEGRPARDVRAADRRGRRASSRRPRARTWARCARSSKSVLSPEEIEALGALLGKLPSAADGDTACTPEPAPAATD